MAQNRGPRGRGGQDDNDFIDRVVSIRRVAKVVKGGRRFGFSSMVVVGDGKGHVGYNIGRAREVPESIRKGIEKARGEMINVPILQGTIPYEVRGRFLSTTVLLKPALEGTGVIAGGPVRAVLEAAGIKNILTKSHGSNNPLNTVAATFEALKQLRHPEEKAARRGKNLEDLVG